MSGIDAEHFNPDSNTTRFMIMTSLARMDGVNTGDVAESEAGRQWAMSHTTPDGQQISNGERLEQSVTRQQLAAMLYRYALYRNVADAPTETQSHSFMDANLITDYAKEAVKWCSERGIVQGYPDNTFQPEGTATRAHMAVMLYRFHTFLSSSTPQTPPPPPQIPPIDGEPEAQMSQTPPYPPPQTPSAIENPETQPPQTSPATPSQTPLQPPQTSPGSPPQMPPSVPSAMGNSEQTPPPPPPQTPPQTNE